MHNFLIMTMRDHKISGELANTLGYILEPSVNFDLPLHPISENRLPRLQILPHGLHSSSPYTKSIINMPCSNLQSSSHRPNSTNEKDKNKHANGRHQQIKHVMNPKVQMSSSKLNIRDN